MNGETGCAPGVLLMWKEKTYHLQIKKALFATHQGPFAACGFGPRALKEFLRQSHFLNPVMQQRTTYQHAMQGEVSVDFELICPCDPFACVQ